MAAQVTVFRFFLGPSVAEIESATGVFDAEVSIAEFAAAVGAEVAGDPIRPLVMDFSTS